MAWTGRPPKYKKAYCSQLIDFMEKGYSLEAFAGKISVGRQTLYDWLKAYPEFAEAYKIAKAKCQITWEEIGLNGAKGGDFSAPAWIFNMKNRFMWRDKQEIDHTQTGELKLKIDFSGLSDKQFKELGDALDRSDK